MKDNLWNCRAPARILLGCNVLSAQGLTSNFIKTVVVAPSPYDEKKTKKKKKGKTNSNQNKSHNNHKNYNTKKPKNTG